MPDFAERFKNIDNQRLLQIIEDPDDYQPEAVIAATEELANRQIDQGEIEAFKARIQHERATKQKREKQLSDAKRSASRSVSEFLAALSPVQIGEKSARQKIIWFSIVFGVISFNSAYETAWFIYGQFTYGYLGSWDIELSIILITGLLPFLAVILFWLVLRLGWILITGYLTFGALNALLIFLHSFESGYTYGNLDYTIERVFPTTSPLVYFFHMLFFLGGLWLVFGDDVRGVFGVEQKTGYTTIIVSAIISSALAYYLL